MEIIVGKAPYLIKLRILPLLIQHIFPVGDLIFRYLFADLHALLIEGNYLLIYLVYSFS